MIGNGSVPETFIIGPNGQAFTREDLPPVDTNHWVMRRKAEVVAAIRGNLLTQDEACARYNLSLDELVGWMRAIERSGFAGLRVTRTQEYRARYKREQHLP